MNTLALCISLIFMFAFLIFTLAVELYCLTRKKERVASREDSESDSKAAASRLRDLMCWKKPHDACEKTTGGGDDRSTGDVELGLKESVESELIRLHNLGGPPRLLFTITEETKEELDSDCDRTRKASRASVSDNESSPGLEFLNPLYEAEIYRLQLSPPPTFKFLRDAEQKLQKKLFFQEYQRKVSNVQPSVDPRHQVIETVTFN